MASDMLVVCKFPAFFLEDISKLPPDREVEITIDLVTCTKLVSIASY